MVRDAVPVAPCASRAVSVIVCDPTVRLLFENDAPVPIWPSRLLVQTREEPESAPFSGSEAEPEKETDAPCATLAPLLGAEIAAEGDWFVGAAPAVIVSVRL